jgi:asparagine synthase (glutamine-hydrolysing)
MCGIVGALSFSDSSFPITEQYIAKMRDTMAHRGPDGGGAWISQDGRVGLGHRRLSIIDLSQSADQPMSNDDGSIQIVFNGEIYNHSEIRSELKSLGRHKWMTDHSDTEVIVQAFAQWGIECLHRFRGMFGLAIWDGRNRELWLARDRIGVKPVYYSIHHGRVTFASEIKALLQDPDQRRQVNEEGVFHYLSFLTTPAPQTMFQGIRKLSPGTWLRIRADGATEEQRYWDVWDHAISLGGVSEEEIAERILNELRISVKLRKVSDVPVGVFLSGGVDSSTNAVLFSEGETRRINTFTIGYQGEYESCRNELHFARKIAEQVNSEHHELLLTQDDLIQFLPRMVQLQDEPIGDPVCVPVYYVSKLARDNGVVVCQLGEGADELFWGYPTWKLKLRLQRLNDQVNAPAWLKKMGLGLLRCAGMGQGRPYEALSRVSEGLPLFWGGVDAFTQSSKEALLADSLRSRLKGLTSWDAIKPIHDRFVGKAWEKTPLQWMSYVDLNLRLPELLLMRVDKMSMGVSLEGRVPFLDHKFVELAMSIPEAVKTKGGVLKSILKKSVRGLIPDDIIDRPKQGFGVPVYEWIQDRLGGRIREDLKVLTSAGVLRSEGVQKLIDAKRGPQLWYLLNLALWWKEYIQ